MSSSFAAAPHVVRSGVWDGSEVDDDDIEILRQTRRLPDKDLVRVRLAPEGEISPAPVEGERVIFHSHLMRGLGLRRVASSAPSWSSTGSSRTTGSTLAAD